eukprot:GHVU01225533.1.p2 GENE.GHVU01225533.1~~GHVU01225533.1.p2  ORF type:complete len:161 (-),score=11.27 GHVU01225533.1:243-725(-)
MHTRISYMRYPWDVNECEGRTEAPNHFHVDGLVRDGFVTFPVTVLEFSFNVEDLDTLRILHFRFLGYKGVRILRVAIVLQTQHAWAAGAGPLAAGEVNSTDRCRDTIGTRNKKRGKWPSSVAHNTAALAGMLLHQGTEQSKASHTAEWEAKWHHSNRNEY